MPEPVRLLVIMGSGETSPTMVTPHQQTFARLEADGPVPAVLLDTPFGFQENADDLAAKAVEYFRVSVGRTVEVASYRSQASAAADPLRAEQALDAMRTARWLFAGPGSPTYALRAWQSSPIPQLLAQTLQRGGAVTFASAAALTLGLLTVPVYEVYKVGEDPRWLTGLDLLGQATGLRAAVIPHFDNAEGRNHDTRYCYLGERRLRGLEQHLPEGVFVLGVDEHTGLIFDLNAGTATVLGRGAVTVRRGGRSATIGSGQTLPLEQLPDLAGGGTGGKSAPAARMPEPGSAQPAARASAEAATLGEAAERREQAFAAALAARDVNEAVAAVLGLEQDMADWSRDTLQGDDYERARAVLRGMVVRLGDTAEAGAADPRALVAPYIEALLAARAEARDQKAFALADQLRDGLSAAGVQVRDTPDGAEWELPG